MPKAVATGATERYDLKSLPEGFVVLRKLTYGELLRRRDLATSFSPGQGNQVNVEMHSVAVQFYEFSKCIVDHNLEDESGNKLNFQDRAVIEKLDTLIAQEIEDLVNKMNVLPDASKEETKSVSSDSA